MLWIAGSMGDSRGWGTLAYGSVACGSASGRCGRERPRLRLWLSELTVREREFTDVGAVERPLDA